MVDRDQLITEIARVTGTRLSTADPIIAAVVINDVLFDKALVRLEQSLKVSAERQAAAAAQQAEASKLDLNTDLERSVVGHKLAGR